MKNDDFQHHVSTHGYMIAQRSPEEIKWLSWSYAAPQAQANEFAAGLEAERVGVHFAAMPDDQPAQQRGLFWFAGRVHFKGNVLREVLDCLPAIPLCLRLWHISLALLAQDASRVFSLAISSVCNGSTTVRWL